MEMRTFEWILEETESPATPDTYSRQLEEGH